MFISTGTMAKGGIPSIPDYILDDTPNEIELLNHAQTAKWRELGMRLEIEKVIQDQCNSCAEIYQKWLATKPKPEKTRRILIDVLNAMHEVQLADNYIKHLATMVSLNN